MVRPQVTVSVEAALQRRGAPTDTGVAFIVYAGASGPSTPTLCLSKADALAALVPETFADYVGEALTQGAPSVWVLRAAAVNPAAVTGAEWDTALAKLTKDYGPGQVLIPGVSTSAAHASLVDHAADTFRCALLDGAQTATASALTSARAAVKDAAGAERSGLIGGWVNLPGPAGTTRTIPGSVIAAGLIGRNDAYNGHANNAPAFDQGRGAGFVTRGISVTTAFTDAELDTLHDSGVSVIRTVRGTPTLYGWVAVTDLPEFRQLNWGRFAMQLNYGIGALMEQFIGRNIDGAGRLFAEVGGTLRGYLLPFYLADNPALFGETASEAFDVDAVSPNTPTTIAAGVLKALAEVHLAPHTESVRVDVTTQIAEGV